MKHLRVCLQRLPREKHFYRQQASSAGGGVPARPPSRGPLPACWLHTCPSGPALSFLGEAQALPAQRPRGSGSQIPRDSSAHTPRHSVPGRRRSLASRGADRRR